MTLAWKAESVQEPVAGHNFEEVAKTLNDNLEYLAVIEIPSQPGNERQAMKQVASAVEHLDLPEISLERLKTAVAEATMNAMEHGNQYHVDVPVEISVLRNSQELIIRIVDQGGTRDIPQAVMPSLEAKLDGMQSPRGWGLFLIKSMVDDMRVYTNNTHHTVELIINLEEGVE